MEGFLRQSTQRTVKLGPFVDPATGLPVTGADVDQADVRLSKNGGDFAQQNQATSNAAHDEGGLFDVVLNTTDTNTVGELVVMVNLSADANTPMVVKQNWFVLSAAKFDELTGAGGAAEEQVVVVEAPYGVATTFRIPLTGVIGAPSNATGDGTITQDDGTGVDNVDNAPTIESGTLVWTIAAAESTTPSANGPYRTMTYRDQSSPQLWTPVKVIVVTTDHHQAAKPNGVYLSILGHASSQTVSSVRLAADPGVPLFPGMWCYVSAGTGAGQAFTVSTYDDANPFLIVPVTDLATALDDTSRILFYADARGALKSADSAVVQAAADAALTAYDTAKGGQLVAGTVTLHEDYDPAKTAATATDVSGAQSAIQTDLANGTVVLHSDYDDAKTAAQAADVPADVRTELTTELARIDAAISTRATPAQILTTALTEAYAADGAAGTLSQILFGLQAFLQEKSISGTTMTVKKLNGSTTAMTFTLDDATDPTSLTRAS
jgi:hypothetical protein